MVDNSCLKIFGLLCLSNPFHTPHYWRIFIPSSMFAAPWPRFDSIPDRNKADSSRWRSQLQYIPSSVYLNPHIRSISSPLTQTPIARLLRIQASITTPFSLHLVLRSSSSFYSDPTSKPNLQHSPPPQHLTQSSLQSPNKSPPSKPYTAPYRVRDLRFLPKDTIFHCSYTLLSNADILSI